MRRAQISSYLAELSALSGRAVSADELMRSQETLALRDAIKRIPKETVVRCVIPFEERTSDDFVSMINQLQALNDSPIVLWLPKANDFGPLVVSSLKHVNFAFPFEIVPEGMLVIATKDS